MGLINQFLKGSVEQQKTEIITAKIEGQNIADQRLREAKRIIAEYETRLKQKEQELANTKKELYHAQDDLEEAEQKNAHYESLLCQPMQEIARQNGNFKETYDKQMELMADWMVSQKAFKELAIEFGFEQGLSPEEVIKLGNEKKIDVLDNNHEEGHGTNASDIPLLEENKEKLKNKIQEKLKK